MDPAPDALPMEMEYVSSLDEVEALCANREPNQICFRLRNSMPLKSNDELRIHVQAGHSGFRVHNRQLLNCKSRARRAVEDGFEQLIKGSVRGSISQMDDARICINELSRLLRSPDTDMLPRGTNDFNRATRARHLGPPPQPRTDDDKATTHDTASRRALWNLNLKVQELRKGLLGEQAYAMNRNLRDLMRETMESPTEVGSGYIDFRFLHSSDQPNYLD